MTATPIKPTSRYFNAAITRVVFCPEVADSAAPTRAELDAGTDLSNEVAELSGWQVTSGDIATPDLGRRFTGNIPGRTTAESSSITFYADRRADDVRALLPRDTEGYIIFMDHGDEPDLPMDVYHVRVATAGKMRSVGDEAARLQVQFSLLNEPAENVTIPGPEQAAA